MFTKAEADMLLNFVIDAKDDGSYYGNKEQYYKRLENIEKKLNLMVEVLKER